MRCWGGVNVGGYGVQGSWTALWVLWMFRGPKQESILPE